MSRPIAVNRHGKILQRLQAKGNVSVADLADRFDVSMETIRRDLKKLESLGLLQTVHGGATATDVEPSLSRRNTDNPEGKAAIGRKAATMVDDGMVILLDSGSTTLALAEALKGRNHLTVLTNSLPIALLLTRTKTIKTLLLGGEVDANDEACFGLDAMEMVKKFRVDLAFVGAGGIAEDGGFTDYSRIAAEQRALMMATGRRAFVLADHTKFKKRTPVRIPFTVALSGLITDELPPNDPAAKAAKRRWPIILANSAE
jgi:DeoR family transcriptional regulator, glycerol-3-phosphate regulon repressor